MTSGSVKLEIPVPAQVLEAASTMAEAFSSMQGSTRLSPLSTLVQIPPGSLKSFWPSALVFIPVAACLGTGTAAFPCVFVLKAPKLIPV